MLEVQVPAPVPDQVRVQVLPDARRAAARTAVQVRVAVQVVVPATVQDQVPVRAVQVIPREAVPMADQVPRAVRAVPMMTTATTMTTAAALDQVRVPIAPQAPERANPTIRLIGERSSRPRNGMLKRSVWQKKLAKERPKSANSSV